MDTNGSSYWVDRKQVADFGAQPDQKTLSEHGFSFRGAPAEDSKKVRVGYGLPCAHCRAYYAADLAACPYCGSADRVTASATPRVNVSAAVNEPLPLHAATGEILPGGDEDESVRLKSRIGNVCCASIRIRFLPPTQPWLPIRKRNARWTRTARAHPRLLRWFARIATTKSQFNVSNWKPRYALKCARRRRLFTKRCGPILALRSQPHLPERCLRAAE